ncbi:hypothetical protein BABINDRAFT_41805 [Babjeviella inositovora NRRL Y-12698]|uniref:Amine oxidase n=1 Tax=Babjeviella inositovora NRRL Y-12698 TaxID=984486 RepID=A0A1E3QI24_9ASCO|nr:uncharacterized protein BABINDRAFT_41805 [Babjeviella inositovora NRRL Y-12698]ODQ77346.1 hypothetical protein BABINDRAFT_41805 [Babjeviella inositovora NRRL Y-12698]
MTHPFDQITTQELQAATKLVKDAHAASDAVHFVQVDRIDPPKSEMVRYLEAEKEGRSLPIIPRRAYVYYYTKQTEFNKAIVNLTYGHVITKQRMPQGVVGPVLGDDMVEIEEYALRDPIVLAEIAKLKLPTGYDVRCEPWIYGTDNPKEDRLLIQVYMYLIGSNKHVESNHYSLPLKFSPVFEMFTNKFVRMDYLPAGLDEKTCETFPWEELKPVEYFPSINGEDTLRELKPLIYQQPEGPSFSINGNAVEWQGWKFMVVPNAREGFAIYDVSFKGRSVLYRLALSEMTVPYGDPRAPYHRKQAFDLGDCGFGANADSLALGCDCLGVVKYLDVVRTDKHGNPVTIAHSVCMHEQDYGLLYKHVNYRTGTSVQARRREFVVQTVATVANYEYVVNIVFDQAGAISVQVRATGILSTMPIEVGKTVDWGTVVAPGVLAAHHQHLLSFRIDPAIDGHKNTVVYDDVVTMELNTALNPFNVGFISKRSYVEKPGFVEQSPFTNRAFKVINELVINPTTLKPVGYKIDMPARQMILGSPDSYNVKRAKFATQQLWAVKYADDELYAAGEFTNQSQKDTGVAAFLENQDSIRNDDVVLFATMALTHVPRAEDFPVMPTDMLPQINILPFGFFEKNPALDIPQSVNSFNKSVYYDDSVQIAVNAASGSCCSKEKL